MGGLPEAAIAHYRDHGYYAPVRVMSVTKPKGSPAARSP